MGVYKSLSQLINYCKHILPFMLFQYILIRHDFSNEINENVDSVVLSLISNISIIFSYNLHHDVICYKKNNIFLSDGIFLEYLNKSAE